jgi:choline-sulfatase
MLGLAGADEKVVAKALRQTHNQVRPLVGRDLSGFLLGEVEETTLIDSSVYFMTDDQPFRGANAVSALGNAYQPVQQPASVETVVAYLPTGQVGEKQRWKLSRYFDNPQFWSQPNVQDVQTFIPGPVNSPGTKTATTTVKATNPTTGQIAPPADQYELYNPTVDPAELDNLYGISQFAEQQEIMLNLLTAQRQQKRLAPTEQPWADGSAQQFPFTPS